MFNIKYKLLLFFILVSFSFHSAYAGNIDIIQEEGYFFQEEGMDYYVGKKKLDSEKLSQITSAHESNYLINLFQNNQLELHDRVLSNYADSRVETYESLYYPIILNGVQNITSIKDFLGNEMNFSIHYEGENTHIRLYYDSFMNRIEEMKYGNMVEDLVWKYGSEYVHTPKKIFIHLDNESIIDFDFKFYIPELVIQNSIIENNNNGNKYVIIGSDSTLSGVFSGSVQVENIAWHKIPWNAVVNEGKNEILFDGLGLNPVYQIFFGGYDFVSIPYQLMSSDYICGNSDQENMQLQVSSGDFNLNIGKYGNEISDILVELKKFNFSNKTYDTIGTFPLTFESTGYDNIKKIIFPTEMNNGLYKMEVKSYSTLKMDICNTNNSSEVKDELFNSDNLISKNFEFIVKDNSFYDTVQLKDIFYNFYEGLNSFDSQKFEFLDVFEYTVKTSTGDVLFSVDKECHLDNECRDQKNQLLISYFNQKGDFSELVYEINYKFFFDLNIKNVVVRLDIETTADIFDYDVNFIHLIKSYKFTNENYTSRNFRIYNFYDFRENIKVFIEMDNQVIQLGVKPEVMIENFYYQNDCSEYSKYCDIDVFVKEEYSDKDIKVKIEYDNGKIIETLFQDEVSKYSLPESEEDIKDKASENNVFFTQHYFLKSFTGVLFTRKIYTYYNPDDNIYEYVTFTFDAQITGDNIAPNYDKLFVCESEKRDVAELNNSYDCYSVNDLKVNERIFQKEVFLYGLDDVVGGEGKSFNTTIQLQSIPKYYPQNEG